MFVSLCACVSTNELKKIVESKETPVPRQRLGEHFPAAATLDATIEELLDLVFSMRSLSHQLLNI
jgi:hypothetical protein